MVSSTSLPGCYFFGLSLDKKRNLDNIPIPLEGEMAKSKRTISFLLPPYGYPPNAWREAIHRRAVQAARLRGVRLKDFKRESAVAVDVKLYLSKGGPFDMHDVDNRLKDILDALQGSAGGAKGARSSLAPKIIANDSSVRSAVIRKTSPPKNRLGDGGRVTIRSLRS